MIRQQLHTRLMGSSFELLVVEEEENIGQRRLQEGVAEIRRIEALLTEFDPDSQTSLLNRYAGVSPVKTDPEVYQILQRCLHLSHLTQGAFDVTAVALRSLYNFKERDLFTLREVGLYHNKTFTGKLQKTTVCQNIFFQSDAGETPIAAGEDHQNLFTGLPGFLKSFFRVRPDLCPDGHYHR